MPSRPLPLIDPRELARRNNESRAAKPRRAKGRCLKKLFDQLPPLARPIRAVGFFYPERNVGFHDTSP